jgi:DNA polymerase-1
MRLYSGVNNFHSKNSELLRTTDKFVTYTLYGRAMLVDKFTNANNFPVQGTGADMLKLAVVRFMSKIDKSKATIINLIHDEIIVRSTTSYKDVASDILKEAMEYSANILLSQFKTSVEVNIITN